MKKGALKPLTRLWWLVPFSLEPTKGGVIMKRKLLIGTIVVLGIAVAIFMPMGIGVVAIGAIGVCIYLVFMLRKKKTSLFHDQVEPKIVERRYKTLKVFLLVAGISLAVGIVGVVLHNVQYGLTEIEESVFFTIALVGIYVFIIATSGGLVIFLKGRRKPT